MKKCDCKIMNTLGKYQKIWPWIGVAGYAIDGAEAVLNAGSHRKVYDYETKLAAVKEHVERGKSVLDVMVKYQIPSESSLKAWCRAYRRDGAHALVNKRRGRKPGSSEESSS